MDGRDLVECTWEKTGVKWRNFIDSIIGDSSFVPLYPIYRMKWIGCVGGQGLEVDWRASQWEK